jgi:hypothetical protein
LRILLMHTIDPFVVDKKKIVCFLVCVLFWIVSIAMLLSSIMSNLLLITSIVFFISDFIVSYLLCLDLKCPVFLFFFNLET